MINQMQQAPFTAINLDRVLVASSTVNRFGQPARNQDHPAGTGIPGGGTSVGVSAATAGVFTHSALLQNQNYYYKMWMRDADGFWIDGPVADAASRNFPTLHINEMRAAGGTNGWVELYNAGTEDADLNQYRLIYTCPDGTMSTRVFPSGATVPQNGHRQLLANNGNGTYDLPFLMGSDGRLLELWTGDPENPQSRLINDWRYETPEQGWTTVTSMGRSWDGGPSGRRNRANSAQQIDDACPYQGTQPSTPGAANNTGGHIRLVAASMANGNIALRWNRTTTLPPVWLYSPKQQDNFPINVEGIAYRNANEVIIGLRSPLDGTTTEALPLSQRRGTGRAFYFLVNNLAQFLPGSWPANVGGVNGVTGPFTVDLGGQGFRSIEWVPGIGGDGAGRYLIIGGPANGGPLEREIVGEKFSLYSWTGNAGDSPVKLIDDLRPYTTRPEGVDLIQVDGQWRVLFVEDRFESTGYGTRNAIHWPLNILGNIF
jgi:hypothetical protein